MKKILLVLIVGLFMVPFCFAQEPSAAIKAAPVPSEPAMAISGKVSFVTLGDVSKATKSEIVLLDDSGKEVKMRVSNMAVMTDKDGNRISLDKISSGQSVSVKYRTTKEGIRVAVAVKVTA
jgi:hypothetical protein